MIDKYAVMGPTPCITCRRPVIWERVAGRWWLGELTTKSLRHHACRPRCLAAMKGREVCLRLAGHAGVHHSRVTLDRRAAWMRSAA